MAGIVVVFPRAEDARGIRNLLVRSGFSVHAVCTTGAQAISQTEDLNSGIVISGYKLPDMMYSELQECLPEGFDMLLMASGGHLAECDTQSLVSLSMPLKAHELISTVEMMLRECERKRKKRREMPRERKPEENALIEEAKELLMLHKSMSEKEAHKYLQKCSMDSGTNMVETARMVFAMFGVSEE